jgi:hypothetical protein
MSGGAKRRDVEPQSGEVFAKFRRQSSTSRGRGGDLKAGIAFSLHTATP